ncbi:BON domain-containing protein [Massilia sp. S19_KUP03_FR1]|uniref:BON domain-containing protein n=1 Tax=Massilia sp. S19_KUP03_FR1 TaxID=3025503 RepID=UPI002FCD8231
MNNKPVAKAVLCAALLASALSVTGCFPLVVGGVAMGAAATADRRTLGAQTEDKSITVKAEMRLGKLGGDNGHINIASFNRKVLITGEVPDAATKATAEREVRAIEGVQSVENELIIAGPASYTSRSSDALVTTKVKASLVEMTTISAASFKVVTENGTVYLMGRVTQREGDVATNVTRGVTGVQKVVKLFEYITEEELRAITPQATQSIQL